MRMWTVCQARSRILRKNRSIIIDSIEMMYTRCKNISLQFTLVTVERSLFLLPISMARIAISHGAYISRGRSHSCGLIYKYEF